jgi:putative endonuclease
MNYTYILRCADGTLYTGWTNDLKRRLYAHNSGTGCKYTRTRAPVELAYCEEFEDKRDAQRREYAIKKLPRQEKERLIESQLRRSGDTARSAYALSPQENRPQAV